MRLTAIVTFLLVTWPLFAQNTKRVKGEAFYEVPDDVTEKQARANVVEMARLKALADTFGMLLSDHISQSILEELGHSDEAFSRMSVTDVRGVWISTEKEEITKELLDGKLFLRASVQGQAREIKSTRARFTTKFLRNGMEKQCVTENNQFYDGDTFYLSFTSPIKGYLIVYIVDEEGNATPIVPTKDNEYCTVKRNKHYFFVENPLERLILTCKGRQEVNKLYIIFSPNKLTLGSLRQAQEGEDLQEYASMDYNNVYRLPYTPRKAFQKWLSGLGDDPEAQVELHYITIRKPQSSWIED